MTIETTEEYWDCECDKDYIHPKNESFCLKCGTTAEDSPDSRIEEVQLINTTQSN